MASAIGFSAARFVLAAHRLDQLPADQGKEVAIVGRSNSGKSTAVNALTRIKGLARVSKTPGRTQQLVVFALGESDLQRRLVDLPGYGYAKVPQALREHWGKTLNQYFDLRESLAGLALTMDVRHPLTAFDEMMIGLCQRRRLPYHVLLTKADKLSRSQGLATKFQVEKALAATGEFSVQLFSAPKNIGIDQARLVLSAWLK